MATPPSPFGFFSPGRRRRVVVPPVPAGPLASQQLLSSAQEALSAANAPAQIGENIKEDLKDAFGVKAQARPGYEPGKATLARVNLLDLVTDPAATIWKTASSPFSTKWSDLIPQLDVAWKTSESAVWDTVFANHLDALGNQVTPFSLQQAIKRWTEVASIRGARVAAEEKGIRENPGLTQMMAVGLANYYAPAPGIPLPTLAGVSLQDIIDSSRLKEREIAGIVERAGDNAMGESKLLKLADAADRSGNPAEAARLRARAASATGGYREAMRLWKEAGRTQKEWAENFGSPAKETQKEFERLMRTDPAFAASPEAQLWKYWQNRNLHYQTLNYLKTFNKDGAFGVFREYVWGGLDKRLDAFLKTHPRLIALYPPKAIEAIIKKTLGPAITPALNKLTDLQSFFNRWKKGIMDIPEEALKKFGKKIGLQKLATRLLGRLAFAGGPVGVVIGALLTFFGDELVKALGGPVKLVFAVFAAVIATIMIGITLVVMFVAVIIPAAIGNIPFPWQISGAVAQTAVQITKGVCEPAPDCTNFGAVLNIAKDGAVHKVRWQITVKNLISEELKDLPISDTEGGIKEKVSLAPGEEKTFTSSTKEIAANSDKLVVNLASIQVPPTITSDNKAIPAGFQTAAASVVIGSPEVGCFDFSGISDGGERSLAMAQAQRMVSFSPAYQAFLCAGGKVPLVRETGSDGSWVEGSTIHLGNVAFGSANYLFYALAHESGHVYGHRNSRVIGDFCRQFWGRDCVFVNPGKSLNAPEGYILTYPDNLSHCRGRCWGEDFAEMIGVYLSGIGNSGQSVNLPSQYPTHTDFAKSRIFERKKGT